MDKYFPFVTLTLLVVFEWRFRRTMLLLFAVAALGGGINGLLFAMGSWMLVRPLIMLGERLSYYYYEE